MVYSSNYCIFDVETTGLLNESRAEIIEFACIILKASDLSELARYKTLIQPQNIDLDKPIPAWSKKAFEVNKINPKDLKDAPNNESVCNKLIGMFKTASKPILVGHNIVSFDIPFLNRLFGSCHMKLSDYIHYFSVDTLPLSHLLWSGDNSMPNIRLGTVAQKMSIEMNNAHRAMVDVEANTEVFKKMVNGFVNFSSRMFNGKVIQGAKKSNQNSNYKCPKCDGYLVVRTAKKGRNAGSDFYGCTGFPKCRFACSSDLISQYSVKK